MLTKKSGIMAACLMSSNTARLSRLHSRIRGCLFSTLASRIRLRSCQQTDRQVVCLLSLVTSAEAWSVALDSDHQRAGVFMAWQTCRTLLIENVARRPQFLTLL